MKYQIILRREVWKIYRDLPLLGKIFCRLARHNPDYSMFIAGIIAGFPATLLMNLVTINGSEITRPVWYAVLYGVSFLASTAFCAFFFRLSVLHENLHKEAEKMADHGLGTEEEKINDLVIAFEDRYPSQLRGVIFRLLGSMILTVFGILGTFLVQIL